MSDETVDLDKADVDAETEETVATDETTATIDPEQEWREGIEQQLAAILKATQGVREEVGPHVQTQVADLKILRGQAHAEAEDANRRARRNSVIAVIFALLFMGATLTGAHFYDAERAANSNDKPVKVVIDRDGLWVNGQFEGYVDDPYAGTAESTRELPVYCEDIKDFILQFPLGDRLTITESCQP